MIERRRSLRWRLTLAVAFVLVLAFAITYVAVYRGTGAQLSSEVDRELRVDANAFARAVDSPAATARALAAAGRRYVAAQPFTSTSRLLFETVPGAGIETNEPDALGLLRIERDETAARQAHENQLARQLLRARPGYSTLHAPDVGGLRLLVRPVKQRGRTVATIGVGEPLATVRRAQEDVRHTFLLAGGLTLAAALLVSFLIAARFSRPLQRMAAIAARVDAGDLSPRIGASGTRDEARVLADAFDHMLDRLQDAFARQRAFVADASHELRTPLTAIRGQLELLAREPDPSPADLGRVQRLVDAEIDRMARLVDDLLLLAHSDEPRLLETTLIDLPSYIDELFELARQSARRRFELDAAASGTLRADPDRVAQALHNLLRNAIEHTAEGGLVRLSVVAEPSGDRVRFIVEDDGPGIPPDQRDRIFDRFQRVDGSRTRAAGGAGLGLAIVAAIAEAHGGRVWAAASHTGGARIELELPGYTRPSAAHSEPFLRQP
jgi:signal transduction histidine kinase